MTRRRRPNDSTFGGADDGVSNVIGAIMVVGIMVMAMAMVQTRYVPVWQEQREAELAGQVAGQLAQVASDLDRLTGNRTSGSVAAPVQLAPAMGLRFFEEASVSGHIEFLPAAAGTGISASSPRLTVFQSGDQVFYGLAEPDDWLVLDNVDDTIENLSALRALRIRIDMVDPAAYGDGASATLTITDRNGAYAGHAVMTFRHIGGSERALETKVFSASGNEVSSEIESFFHNTNLGNLYIDLMEQKFLFDAVFAAGPKPVTLTMVRDGLTSDYVVVYDVASAGGASTPVGPAVGLVLEPYQPAPLQSGVLRLEMPNQRFVHQTYILEHGALLRVQDGAAVFVVPPRLHVAAAADTTVVEWTLPSMTGAAKALAGGSAATVVAHTPVSSVDLGGRAPSLTFGIPTQYAATWAQALERALVAGGLEATHYSITTDAASVTLDIQGQTAGTSVDDMVLFLKQAQIEIQLEPR